MSNEGIAAQQEADAIIKSLGLEGDGGPGSVAEIVSRIEGAADAGETPLEEPVDTGTDKGDQSQAESLTATSQQDDKGGASQKQDGGKAAATEGDQPAGVLLKDGKHFLPYDKHVEERRARVEAEARVKALEDELTALRAGKATGGQPGEGDGKPATTGNLQADLAMVDELEAKAKAYEEEGLTELAANTATQAKVMRSLMSKVEELGGYVQKFQERERTEQERTQLTEAEKARQAVENNPTLRYLDETYDANPKSKELWDRIDAEARFLASLPKYAKVPIEERFAAAVRRVEADEGQISLPPEYQTTAQVRAAAEARTRKQGSEFRPHTLSDLPGGGTPRGADDDPFENLDPVQLERLMDDPKKMNEILARAPTF